MKIELLGKEVRFLIPILRNSDQQLHDITIWEWLETQMHIEFPNGWQLRAAERSGNTIRGTVRGQWFDKDKNENVPDDCVEYVVAVPPERMQIVYTLLETICQRFDQKCIYFTTGGDAAIYHPTPLT